MRTRVETGMTSSRWIPMKTKSELEKDIENEFDIEKDISPASTPSKTPPPPLKCSNQLFLFWDNCLYICL